MSGPKRCGLRVILASPTPAHGDESLLSSLVSRWPADFVQVTLLGLDHRQSDAQLLSHFRAEVNAVTDSKLPLVIGGFSLGARLAVTIAPEFALLGVLAFSFPAHKHRHPQEKHGVEVLRKLETPTLIVQGTRDSHGSKSEVQSYQPLPSCIVFHWLSGANHRWQNKLSSPIGPGQHLDSASKASLQFLSELVSSVQ